MEFWHEPSANAHPAQIQRGRMSRQGSDSEGGNAAIMEENSPEPERTAAEESEASLSTFPELTCCGCNCSSKALDPVENLAVSERSVLRMRMAVVDIHYTYNLQLMLFVFSERGVPKQLRWRRPREKLR